jgi:hypothetical protein
VADLLADLRPQRQVGVLLDVVGVLLDVLDVDDMLDAFAQRQPDFVEPEGVQVGAQQALAAQVEARGAHCARHHLGRAREKVLVVIVPRAAVGDNEPGLPLAPCASAALGVVGGRRGHIAQMHKV